MEDFLPKTAEVETSSSRVPVSLEEKDVVEKKKNARSTTPGKD